jgi:hypothetical protein
MANFFEKAKDNASSLEASLLGPNYKYYDYINTPSDIGMSSEGSIGAITNNIAGLMGYVKLLSSGGGIASKTGGPLGNKFFLETGAKCSDIGSGESVTRSLYVNNVPDGSIPFVSSGLGVNFTEFKGLIPGTLSNLAQINPMQIFGAFMSGSTPACQAITMETIDVNNIKSNKTAYVTTNDIVNMSACWFENKTNPVTKAVCKEAFTSMRSESMRSESMLAESMLAESMLAESMLQPTTIKRNSATKERKRTTDYSAMPKDVFAKLYYSSLSLLLIYIFLKVFQKRLK